MFVLTGKQTLTLKNRGERSFSYETKASMSFIPIRRISSWCPIVKGKRLLSESLYVSIDIQTLILKNGGKKSFLNETKASMSLILMSRMSLWHLILKREEIIM